MRRILGLLVCIVLFNSCDDGDLIVESFDFSNATAQRCDDKIYKLTTNEALIFKVPFETAFINDATPVGAPITFPISATNFVVYRAYSGTVASTSVCADLPPTTPNVTEEWTASSGTIEIVTTATVIPNTKEGFEGGEKISKYVHTITFRNINFIKPDGSSQLYQTFVFGTYDVPQADLPLNFDDNLEKCSNSNRIFNFVGSEALTLDIDPSLILNEVTTTPRIGLIGSTTNVLNYQQFINGTLNADYFCTTPIPATPTIVNQFTAVDGISNISGIIEVTTTTGITPNTFEHTIHLKNVTLKRGNSQFLLATDYLFGTVIVAN